MDFLKFLELYKSKRNPNMSERSFILSVYRRVLDGTYYDILPNAFSAGSAQSGASVNVLEPSKFFFQTSGMSQRRPSVKSSICSLVVDDAVSFLFDETHFPRISSEDKELEALLKSVLQESQLNLAMIQLARDGSVGSGALLVKLLGGRFYFESLLTEYCQPVFDPMQPGVLIGLCEQFTVMGSELIAQGYDGLDATKVYWYRREWDANNEIVYMPVECSMGSGPGAFSWQKQAYKSFAGAIDKDNGENKSDGESDFVIDKSRSYEHGLGFVPIVWVKNLPGNIYGFQGSAIDGACTFAKAIDTVTELDYQLSQCGRGLKYSSEPILFIKNQQFGTEGPIDKSQGGVIIGDENSDAKMVEINGDGCKAVLDYAMMLREIAIENIHGNRSSPKNVGFSQSGKAMQMYNHPLILLAGLMRISYGEGALKTVLKMIAKMAYNNDVVINNKIVRANFSPESAIDLVWPQWYDPTPQDEQAITANTIAAKDAGLISHKTALANVSDMFGILNIDDELAQIELEQQEFEQEQKPMVQEIIKA